MPSLLLFAIISTSLPALREVVRHEERCIHCTACVAPCPTKALDVVDRRTMTVAFDRERCIACEVCLKVFPYQAMEILFD